MNLLLIDNYDSFTYNLFQQIAAVHGKAPIVMANDEICLEDITRLDVSAVVFSPGPGRPEQLRDFGVCGEVIQHLTLPILGVCLGHQGLAYFHGGRIIQASQIMHGRTATIHHRDDPLFQGIPREFTAVRYHSLAVSGQLPEALKVIAWSGDGEIMGLRHTDLPFWGIQFHPESICSDHGHRIIANFLDLAGLRRTTRPQFHHHATNGAGTGTDPFGRCSETLRLSSSPGFLYRSGTGVPAPLCRW